MSDVPKEFAACSAYLKQAAQIAPQSLASAFAIVMLATARECAQLSSEPAAGRSWDSLLASLHDRAHHECRTAPSTVPVVDRLLHHFQAFGDHHLRGQQ
jgi:hypothetical protein